MMSVLMATHNGADTIERTLTAMSRLNPPEGGWKLVVVNNASTDVTGALVRKWRGRLPLEYLVEPRLGKAKAINTALAHAEGDLIVMTDDDVLPDRNWLTVLRRVAEAFPQCAIFGGAIIPAFDEFPTPWPMPRPWLTVLFAQTPDYAEGEIAPRDVSGANITIRKSVCDAGHRFDENRPAVGSPALASRPLRACAISSARSRSPGAGCSTASCVTGAPSSCIPRYGKAKPLRL